MSNSTQRHETDTVEKVQELFDKLDKMKELAREGQEVGEEVTTDEFRNPFREYQLKSKFSSIREEIIRLAAIEFASSPEIVDQQQVVDYFENREATPKKIQGFVHTEFDKNEESIAKEKIVSSAVELLPYNNDSVKIYSNGKLILNGGSWDSLYTTPHDIGEKLGAFEKFSLNIINDIPFSRLLNVQSPVERYIIQYSSLEEELLETKDFSDTNTPIDKIKLHKNGSIHVWTEDEETAEAIINELEEEKS